MRYLLFLLLLLALKPHSMSVSLATDESWCQISQEDVQAISTPEPDFSAYAQYVDDPSLIHDVGSSDDGSRLFIRYYDWDEYEFEVYGVNLETEEIYFHFTELDLIALRGKSPEDFGDLYEGLGIEPRILDWIPGTHQLVMQLAIRHINDGEGGNPADDLHLIQEDGSTQTILPPGEAGKIALSPDGQYLFHYGLESAQFMDTTNWETSDDLLASYRDQGDERGWIDIVHVGWRSNSVDIFFHVLQEEENPYSRFYRPPLLRVYVSLNREVSEIASYNTGGYIYQFSADGTYFAYTDFDTTSNVWIENLQTGEEYQLGTSEFPNVQYLYWYGSTHVLAIDRGTSEGTTWMGLCSEFV